MSRQRILAIAILVVLVVTGVIIVIVAFRPTPTVGTPVNVPGGTFRDVTAPQLAEMLQDKDFVFINTHIPYEGEIAETDDLVPYDEIAQSLDRLPEDKSAKIVLYCRSGNMSATASETLVSLGYTNVFNLTGGMKAWREAGYPIIEDGE